MLSYRSVSSHFPPGVLSVRVKERLGNAEGVRVGWGGGAPSPARTPPRPRCLSLFFGCAGVASDGIEEHLLQPQPPNFSAFLAPFRTFRLTSARRVSDAATTSVRPGAHRCAMRCRLSARRTSDSETDCFHARRDVRGPGAPEPVERPRPQNGPQVGASLRSAGSQAKGGWS